jgi:ABC-type antimicrobial peptide transport system permease subunit
MLVTMVVAAASLTVSVLAAIVERRRPFALLRTSGMPLRHLRQLVLFETSVPLVVTTAGAIAVTYLLAFVSSLAVPDGQLNLLTWPGGGFLVSAATGLLGAVAVSLLSWPLMNAVTGYDSVRYE